jgi:glycosyltransferase involved in cell wall biosynthesis
MSAAPERIALLYDEDAYVEPPPGTRRAAPGRPMGLMGRQVAGKEFLQAYLTHGHWTELVALVPASRSAVTLKRLWETHAPSRRMRVVPLAGFHRAFFPAPPAPILHFPNPPDPRFAWARQHAGPGAFAFSGVTHTICSRTVMQGLCEMVTAPFESFDALVCTSRAVRSSVETVTGAYTEYLRERDGGNPRLRARLELIPLGVDPHRFHPPSAEERAAARRKFRVTEDESAVLFVGRLSFHAKAHPFPLYAGLARARRETGRKLHLLLSGWAPNREVLTAFQDGARLFAPGVRVTILDGTQPDIRFAVWHAADIATALVDNIQETLGLAVLEGMACGLPVVASAWDGHKDTVVDGETGLLVPAYMVRDASRDATSRLLAGEVDYDAFLAECSQTVAVDVGAAASAFARLGTDPALRRRLGEAGRQRVLAHFTWPTVVQAYESLWQGQDVERRAWLTHRAGVTRTYAGPSCYPALEASFASYPTALLGDQDRLTADPDARLRLDWLLRATLTSYAAAGRTDRHEVIAAVLDQAAAPTALVELDAVFAAHGVEHGAGRATIGWMLKYGLLRVEAGA